MADQAITALPKKTYSGSSQIASTDYLLGIDSAEGYQMLIQDLGEYIINRATASLAGSTQTLASAISALNSNSVPLKLLNKPSAKTYTLNLPSNGRFMIVTVPNSATDITLVLATVYGSGAVFINNLSGESNTSFTTGTNTLTATTTTSTPVTFSVLIVALEKKVGVNGVTIS